MNHRPMEGQFDRKIPWNLKEVIGKPASSSFWRDNLIGKFAISHRIKEQKSIDQKLKK
ncbi:hypothetical protein C1H46_036011 [Malus baccata]|uniref:Uncharacterized protein n=1 Tax=Malus baccata TaxID=106549 RepID=A0A540KWN2_MALBA|nr:hypothetical protein C1H46_036011 [Malus baccata]